MVEVADDDECSVDPSHVPVGFDGSGFVSLHEFPFEVLPFAFVEMVVEVVETFAPYSDEGESSRSVAVGTDFYEEARCHPVGFEGLNLPAGEIE